jgi:hypothetical protein
MSTDVEKIAPLPPLPEHISTGGVKDAPDVSQPQESVFRVGNPSEMPGLSREKRKKVIAPGGGFCSL